MNYKYHQELPAEVEAQLDAFIERIKAIKWFQPAADLKKETIDTQVSIALKAFGVEASVEYQKLQTPNDWDAAWDAARHAARHAARNAARDAALGAARHAARNAARVAAWDAARHAARVAAWGAAWDAAWGTSEVLALNVDSYKKKYPTGAFIHLIPLWEAGLYPVGVVNDAFVIYVPPHKQEFPSDLV